MSIAPPRATVLRSASGGNEDKGGAIGGEGTYCLDGVLQPPLRFFMTTGGVTSMKLAVTPCRQEASQQYGNRKSKRVRD